MFAVFQKFKQTKLLTRGLLIAGFSAFLSLLIYYLGLGRLPLFALLSLPGYFLDMLFSVAAFLLPVYLVGMALINEIDGTGWIHLFQLQAIWLPVFTLSPLFKILANDQRSASTAWMIAVFGKQGSLFLLGFLTVVEIFVVLGLVLTSRDKIFFLSKGQGTAQSDVVPSTEDTKPETDTISENTEDYGRDNIRHDPFFDDDEEVEESRDKDIEGSAVKSDSLLNEPEISQKSVTVLYWNKKQPVSSDSPPSPVTDYMQQVDPAEAVFGEIFNEDDEDVPGSFQPYQEISEPPPKQKDPSRGDTKTVSCSQSRPSYTNYRLDAETLLKKHSGIPSLVRDETIEHNSRVLQETLGEFGIEARVVGIKKGPVVTLYEILPAPGVKLSRIVALADNIALVLACGSVRIVAPIPGKNAVGVEVPNPRRQIVGFDELVQSQAFQESKDELPLALGKDIAGDLQIIDLAKTPHLLIAGATGSGKSVMVNSLICSLLFSKSPDDVRLLLVDPKIVELKFFNDIPHLLTPVITDPKKALMAAQWCLAEMERRYSLLDSLGVRDIRGYNAKVQKKNIATTRLPYIVFIIDEFADLMATSGKELEGIIARLAAMSRAVGIHLVLATQRPSIDVITGLIKANFPSRIAFMVASKTDSRIILDQTGAENLLGKGDMLFSSAWEPFPKRIQAAYLSEEEVENIVIEVKKQGKPDYISDEVFIEEDEEIFADESVLDDPLWKKAVEIVTTTKKASASYLQRRMSIGYNRAARLIEEMERQGIVGPQNGSKPREIIASLASMVVGDV